MKLCPKCQKQFSDDANFCPVDAARLVPLEMQAAGGDSLGARFDLGARLGGGRTGAVHRATDKTTAKPCIVKLIAPSVVALPGVAQRLERELKQLERVHSAGVARVLASGKRGDETWVATELIEGARTLSEAITARGPIPVDDAANLVEVIGEALIEAAQVGVVHRDLAPKNVLFAGQDVKLINFSLPVPTSERVPGVPEFVAPEQVEGRPVDQRSNLYSLGALYYYVLTGQTVVSGATPDDVHRQHTSAAIRPPSQLIAVPAPVEAIILRALDRSPTRRFLTVRQFVDEVTRVGHAEVIELKQTMSMGRAGRPRGELVQTLLGVRGAAGLAALGAPPPATVPSSAAVTAPLGTPAIRSAPVQPAPVPVQPAPQGLDGPPAMPPPREAQPSAMAAALAAPPTAMTPLAPPTADAARSPWAPPAAHDPGPALAAAPPAPQPMTPAAPVVAAPVVAAPVVAAPQVAAPQVAAAPAGKKKADEEPASKGKFRETMWFKKGDLDAQAAVAAAEERARSGKEVANDKADSKPIDERYNDDGSITRGDKEKYSLRTGATQMMTAVKDTRASQSLAKVSEDALIGEMKGGRGKIIVAIAIGLAALVALILIMAL
jgi:eukaryotic-like serine/threonine-protein kinase